LNSDLKLFKTLYLISMEKTKINIHWFRRDLRVNDNHALFAALSAEFPVLAIFIFDPNILNHLPKKDARVQFLHSTLTSIHEQLISVGSALRIFHCTPEKALEQLLNEFDVQNLFANRDYEPNARKRDKQIYDSLKEKGITFIGKKDHVIFEAAEVTKDDGLPYTVYTPYSKKWKTRLESNPINCYPSEELQSNFLQTKTYNFPSLEQIGFEKTEIAFPTITLNTSAIQNYHINRDFPAIDGTTRMSLHLRFGTISTRELVLYGLTSNEKWLNELIWREFYQMIIYHFPNTVDHAFKPAYDFIEWNNNEEEFHSWCEGRTGYPLVDAGMRELNETGFMHNRVRMVVASFLTKHLLIDWRWGERYFAEKLLDFDLASNVGGWQWAAGSGCDAAPYFRIFNPTSQMEKFDKQNEYIKKWVPEINTSEYAAPIVEHTFARNRCLEKYKEALLKK
jgi:deoxyribodipyrimidine photo-lyase